MFVTGKGVKQRVIDYPLNTQLSQQCAFSASEVFVISEISFSLTRKELILTSMLYANCDSVLPFFIVVYSGARKSLKRLAFTRMSEMKLLLTSKGGIDGIFLYIRLLDWSLRFLVILVM